MHGFLMRKQMRRNWRKLAKKLSYIFWMLVKTERECVLELTREAEAAGYVSLENKLASGEQIKAGDKIYAVGMKKIMAMFQYRTGTDRKGMNILGATH